MRFDVILQPGPGECPVALGRGGREIERARGILDGEPREEAQAHELGEPRPLGSEPLERLVDEQHVQLLLLGRDVEPVEGDAFGARAALLRQTPPGVIDAETDSTIQPPFARRVLVYHALALWAARGGYQDPAVWEAREQQALFGNPLIPGDIGILGQLKTQNFASGLAAHAQAGPYRWWRPA